MTARFTRSCFAALAATALMGLATDVRAQGAVDLNKASVKELDSLPGIGPSKAKAIVAWRADHGPFKHPMDLRQVKGIGASTYARLCRVIVVAKLRGCNAEGTPPALPDEVVGEDDDPRVNLNAATAAELDALPGIGKTRAAQIIAYRKKHGPFTNVADLKRVKGVGKRTFEKLGPFLRTTINPNSATLQEFVATGAVNKRVARAIVTYRRRAKRRFEAPVDIKRVPAVGSPEYKRLKPFLEIQ